MHDIGETAPWRKPEAKAVNKMYLDKKNKQVQTQGPRIRDWTISHLLDLGCISKGLYSRHSPRIVLQFLLSRLRDSEGPKLVFTS